MASFKFALRNAELRDDARRKRLIRIDAETGRDMGNVIVHVPVWIVAAVALPWRPRLDDAANGVDAPSHITAKLAFLAVNSGLQRWEVLESRASRHTEPRGIVA